MSSISRFSNAAFLNGSTHQTISARAFIESSSSPKWKKRQNFIDAMFFFQQKHCQWAWETEVENARRTLQQNDVKIIVYNLSKGFKDE
jgi:hypothetical protein